jgi:hypothetical protein
MYPCTLSVDTQARTPQESPADAPQPTDAVTCCSRQSSGPAASTSHRSSIPHALLQHALACQKHDDSHMQQAGNHCTQLISHVRRRGRRRQATLYKATPNQEAKFNTQRSSHREAGLLAVTFSNHQRSLWQYAQEVLYPANDQTRCPQLVAHQSNSHRLTT